ncbi:MAG: peroxiredoxin, partial [Porticoccaceae bacterium]|jgi:peroxiredoxin Q/BCP|nr:peroxiredoxin [Porticoccaceae bacterium]
LLSDPSKKVAAAYDVLAFYGMPMRHTVYIGKDGKVLFVDRNIEAATSAEDMASKLKELGIPARQAS